MGQRTEPPNHSADVESTANGVELVVSSRYLRACSKEFIRHQYSSGASRSGSPLGTTVPGTTGPMSREQASKRRPSRPHPIVSIRHSLAVSKASSDVIGVS